MLVGCTGLAWQIHVEFYHLCHQLLKTYCNLEEVINLQILTEMQRRRSVLYTLSCMLIHTGMYSGSIKRAVNGVYTVATEISGLGLTGKCGLTFSKQTVY